MLRVKSLRSALENGEVQWLETRPLVQRQVAVQEQVTPLFQQVFGLEQAFLRFTLVDFGQQATELRHHRVGVVPDRELQPARNPLGCGDVGDQHRVVRGQCATRFRQQLRHRQFALAAQFGQTGDNRQCVLVDRVVHRAERARASAFVVHSEATANVEPADIQTGCDQLGVIAPGFAHAGLNVAQVGDLRAHVKVQQFQPVDTAGIADRLDQLQHLACGETELGALTTGVLPVALAQRRKPETDADPGGNAQCLGLLVDQRPFARLLDDQDHVQTEQDAR